MTFRRGFKADAERISTEIRCELGLSAMTPLDVLMLARHLEIPVVAMSSLGRVNSGAGFLDVLRHAEQDSFSALTLFNGTARLIIHNDSHHPHRQSSNIAHEISHCLLEHPPAPLVSEAGCRYWDQTVEAEADWLAAAMLVPRDGALRFLKNGNSLTEISCHFGVSESLCRWRLYQTGIVKQADRYSRPRR